MKTIKEADFSGKKVFLRVDYNVPLKDGKVADATRITATIPTINYILEKGAACVILASHLGRPKGEKKPELSLKAVVETLEKELGKKVIFVGDCIGEKVSEAISSAPQGSVLLLENLRFYKEEEKNDEKFAAALASLADIFVQDAFAVCHRAHASTDGITKFLPSYAGFLVEKEVEFLGKLLSNPERPFVAILGGAKISTKISVIKNLLTKVDKILIGGAMSYTFLKAKGEKIGNSLFEEEFLKEAKELLSDGKIILPCDHIVSRDFSKPVDVKISKEIPDGFAGVDIGPETIEKYKKEISRASTVFWNGPLGVFEVDEFSKGTYAIARIIAESNCVSVAGGGDSVAAIKKSGVSEKFSHISTGGGASLEFVEGKILPGLKVL